MQRNQQAFTLVEMLVAISILTLIVILVARLLNSATGVTTSANKRIDADAHSRALLDRMSIDFAQMARRNDLDYHFKDPAEPQSGNDQLAFFSFVPGYYPSSGSASPASVVAYRVTPQHQMERMGKGLVWTGVSSTNAPLVFLPLKIRDLWPSATDGSPDPDYEPIGSQVFRFEYYYLLRNGTASNTPWDVASGHTDISGLRDVAAIVTLLATIDPKSRVLLSDEQIAAVGDRLADSVNGTQPGELATQWRSALDGITDMPRSAISSIRSYERYFYIGP